MKIKKYVGETAHEAMIKLKTELGPDAVVLNTKNIRSKGFLGLFRKPLVEITVGYEESDLLQNQINKSYEMKLNHISKELHDLKKTIKDNTFMKSNNHNLPISLQVYLKKMINNGIDPDLSTDILWEIKEQIKVEEKDSKTVENLVKFSLMEKLGKPQPITLDHKQKHIFFVGPTGVGKTTTLAKIATNLVLEDRYDIGMITADTYRIGAVEQLRIYSDILQLPLEVAYNKVDMVAAFEKFKDKDIILIDTAGRSHNDIKQMEELRDILNSTESKDIYLLVNMNINYKELSSIIEKYSFLNDYKLIITKTDEASNYGNFLNIRHITNRELSYYTTGQNVPDDIEIVNVEEIVNKLIEESIDD